MGGLRPLFIIENGNKAASSPGVSGTKQAKEGEQEETEQAACVGSAKAETC